MYTCILYKLEIVWLNLITGIYSPVVHDNIDETVRTSTVQIVNNIIYLYGKWIKYFTCV